MKTPIPVKHLGKDGPLIPVIGFGCMGLSAFYGKPDEDSQRLQVLDRAYELGSRHWDTSDIYGDNEQLIALWFSKNPEKRKDIFLATKFGGCSGPEGFYVRSDPEYVKIACEKSLKDLGVDYIDLYYCHRVDMKTPIEKTVQAMVELKNEGKIRYIGFSELSADSLRRAATVYPIAALQMEYSPFEITIESTATPILATAREFGVSIVAYSPLGRGFMTGKYQSADDFEDGDFRKGTPRYSKENFPKNLAILHRFEEIAKKRGFTSGQICLAWLLAQGNDIFVIPGTKKIKYLDENVGSAEVVLTDAEIAELRKLIEATKVRGERAPKEYAGGLYADTPPLYLLGRGNEF